MKSQDVLQQFHPLIQRWFATRVGEPTDAQRGAWAHIAAGEHVLISSPTGTGKTLAAFLWALDRYVTGGWKGRGQCSYIVYFVEPSPP